MLNAFGFYYAQNYAGIIRQGLPPVLANLCIPIVAKSPGLAGNPGLVWGVAKFTRSEERGCGFVLRKFQQARTAKVCTLALLLNDLEIDSSLLPSPIPSLK